MPITGMRVMISASLQKENKRPPSILAVVWVDVVEGGLYDFAIGLQIFSTNLMWVDAGKCRER